ncbi:MAG: RdgB/HAM1 family non-canonical purine NTP pyrophosphatase [Thermoplasmataceae archaeon]
MIKLVTSNEHKYKEIKSIFLEFGLEVEWVKMSYEEIQDESTARISEDSCRKLQGMIEDPFFLEDTGLYILTLAGFPGPYSSYVNKKIGNKGILKLVGSDRRAYFETVISLSYGGNIYKFDGHLNGTIANAESGSGGFGYDPIFIPDKYNITLSEMGETEKNKISHRRIATEDLIRFINDTMRL